MGLVDKPTLLRELSPPLDFSLTEQLLNEFISLERRFVLRDWEPAELDGGQFVEVLSRILYHVDSGNLNRAKSFDDCASYLENDQVPHSIIPRHHSLHVLRVLRTIYKFRSQRGAIHISPIYSANEMDSKLILESVRWVMIETIRLHSNFSQEQAAKVTKELLQFDVPCIGRFEDILLVQRTDLTAEEEVLILLHYAGDSGFSRREIGIHAKCDPASVTRTLQKLESSSLRQAVLVKDRHRLTDLGCKRVREQLSEKLNII